MRKMYNLKGTLYDQKYPLVRFEYAKGILVNASVILDNEELLPDFLKVRGVSEETLNWFFDRRVPPKDQSSFVEFCNRNKVPTSALDGILHLTHGRWINDDYWVKAENENISWDDVRGDS